MLDIGGANWVRTSGPALMKRPVVPDDGGFDKHNQALVDKLIDFRKATRGITPRGEEWLRDMLRFFLGQLTKPVEDVIPEDVSGFLGHYADRPYQRHCLDRSLTSFYNWLKRTRAVAFNPMDEIDPPKLPKKLLNTVTFEQVPTLIKEARCSKDRAIISLFADSGVRRFELCNILVADVDKPTALTYPQLSHRFSAHQPSSTDEPR